MDVLDLDLDWSRPSRPPTLDSYHLWSLWFLPQGKTFTVFIKQYFYFLFKKRICKMFLGLLFLLYELIGLFSFSSSNVKNVRLFNWNFILFLPPPPPPLPYIFPAICNSKFKVFDLFVHLLICSFLQNLSFVLFVYDHLLFLQV